ncbi:MAG: amino acid ABC transporter ATP-binding protein [Mesorhizobium sp.]|nr:amino acid ABC transporter ATP-binding protein [Mesorhizobium sp.]MBN9241852.1 amino acid ABC transporter ATP-binding protein [Mesorhizobium sp.]
MSLIEIDHLSKSYGAHQVIKDVSLSVEAGEVLAVIGRSGSGKSTLLRCLNGLEQINGGALRIDGRAVTYDKRALRQLRKRVAMVFQSYNLFPHMSAQDNVALAPRIVGKLERKASLDIAHEMLGRVGLSDKHDAYPRDLSGGQQQRVAIARALAVRPEILLLDEVTAALDPELVGEVLKVLGDLASEGLTMVLVTHEIAFARKAASRVAFMHEGRVHEIGPAQDVIGNPQTPELQRFLASVIA